MAILALSKMEFKNAKLLNNKAFQIASENKLSLHKLRCNETLGKIKKMDIFEGVYSHVKNKIEEEPSDITKNLVSDYIDVIISAYR